MTATVFLDFGLEGEEIPLGRVVLELSDRTPKAAENFRQFCTGEFRPNGLPVGYKGCKILDVSNGIIRTGDFMYNNGTGSQSIYGSAYFPSEDLTIPLVKHSLVMWNQGSANTNGCQFMLTSRDVPEMNGKYQVVGSIVQGHSVVDKLLRYSDHSGLRILECGEM